MSVTVRFLSKDGLAMVPQAEQIACFVLQNARVAESNSFWCRMDLAIRV
jgi:hypothetical protein